MNTITPGHWHVVPASGLGMWEIRPDGPFKGNIAIVFHTTIETPTIPFAEAEANARAIALLPELVEACRKALEILEDQDGDEVVLAFNALGVLRPAIAKLKGQP